MSSLGGEVFQGISKLMSGPLGVCQIGFKGYDLGKTTADTTLVPDKDEKDINYQQDGTKAADHVRTGIDYILNATFGEISTGLLVLLMAGMSTVITNPASDGAVLGRSMYQSMREQEAGGLKVAACDENGQPLTALVDLFQYYEAIPIVNGDLINWGADTQRNFPMQFRIKYHVFDDGESSTYYGAFGFYGDPTALDVPALDLTQYPDRIGPQIVSAIATAATTLVITFDKNIAFQTAWDATDYVVNVEGDGFSLSTAGVIATTTLTLTFAAGTFAAGDTISLSITEKALEDTAATPNEFPGVDGYPCTETI